MTEKFSLVKSSVKHADQIAEFVSQETGQDLLKLKVYLYKKLVSDRYLILFARQENTIVGLVECEIVQHNSLFSSEIVGNLKSFYVVKTKRRGGIAKNLLETAKMWLKGNDATSVYALESNKNDITEHFLLSGGYENKNGFFTCIL